LRAKHLLPFDAFDDIPESSPSDESGDKEEKPFLWCPHNQHETAFRSPWTNFYYSVETSNGVEDIRIYERECPPEEQDVRDLEGAANEVWESYVQLYYGKEAIGSVYLKPRGGGDGGTTTTTSNGSGGGGGSSTSSFEGLFGVQKAAGGTGSWDSVHLVKVEEPNAQDKTCEYHVESAVSMSLGLGNNNKKSNSKSDISATLTKDTTKTLSVRYSHGRLSLASHLENLGKIMEDVEIDFRSKLERVHLPSAMEVMQSIYRKPHTSGTAHLMNCGGGGIGDNDIGHQHATGMGVGAGMIGEIASKAKAKAGAMGGGGANPFMEAMKANLAKKAATTGTKDNADGDQYNELRSGLKKRGAPPPPSPVPSPAAVMGLKKTTPPSSGKQQGHHMPSPSMMDLKKTLKKTSVSTKSSEPTPEFMDFRNKLKKNSGIKP
jgi:hypothetical protein